MVGLKARRPLMAGAFHQVSWSAGVRLLVREEVKKVVGRPWPKGTSGNPRGRTKKAAEPPPALPDDALPGEQEALRALWNRAQSGKQGSTAAYKTYLEYLVGKARQREQVHQGPQLSEETAKRICALAEQFGMPYEPCPKCGHVEHGKPSASVTTQAAKSDSGFVPPNLEAKRETVPAPSPDYGKAQDGTEPKAAPSALRQTTVSNPAEERRREHEAGLLPKLS